jgi:pantoate--beta-alanine ligase
MEIVSTIEEVRKKTKEWRSGNRRIGFVPTMGNLHEGHSALIRQARKAARFTVVSTFVNPMQFGPNEDFNHYPRTPEADEEVLRRVGCDLLYRPLVEEIYPRGLKNAVNVAVPGLTDVLCGAKRPGHFEGVLNVCNRLFNIVQPDVAIFGEKDFQQLTIIKRMVEELHMPVVIAAGPTVRAPDGLAISSRNQYLDEDDRKRIAPRLYEEITKAAEAIESGSGSLTDLLEIESKARNALTKDGFEVDYFSIVSINTLHKPSISESDLVVMGAATLGRARLIDNKRCTRL